jgi:hypothetical protein
VRHALALRAINVANPNLACGVCVTDDSDCCWTAFLSKEAAVAARICLYNVGFLRMPDLCRGAAH